jgi:hypothetical protein
VHCPGCLIAEVWGEPRCGALQGLEGHCGMAVLCIVQDALSQERERLLHFLSSGASGAQVGCLVLAGDAFLVVTGSSQIKVYDRDGIVRGESIRGDMYIRDARNTKGHVSPTTYGQWHPTDRCAVGPFCSPFLSTVDP